MTRDRGDAVRSGSVNVGAPFELVATTSAAESTFAGIVRLVEQASAATSPFVRLADRFALVFLAVSFSLAGSAWLISGDEVRVVAVLVVATPCPLILAAPVAIVAGLSRCARRGVVVKGGGPLETLARADVLLFDKTGTLTVGRPTITQVVPASDFDGADMLCLAASLEQVSPHVLAATIVDGARQRGCALTVPTETSEQPGAGVRGCVDGRDVRVGNGRWAGIADDEPWVVRARSLAEFGSASCVFRRGRRPARGRPDPERPDPSRRSTHDSKVAAQRDPAGRHGDGGPRRCRIVDRCDAGRGRRRRRAVSR